MKLITIPAFLLFLAAASPHASAIVTLGTSTQNFGLTGIGGNSAGQGQSKMSWGACTYDGTTTTCTLSGPFTGLGAGGTYSFVVPTQATDLFRSTPFPKPQAATFFSPRLPVTTIS